MSGGWRGLLSPLDVLLVCVPAALYLEYVRPDAHTAIFFTSCVSIVPLAGWMGKATERIADRAGEGIGALLNATFGNAAELIIALAALRAGQFDIVKASLTGAIIGNVLLVLGASFVAGGIRGGIQTFNAVAARAQAQMLLVTSVALIVPALFHALRPAGVSVNEATISLALAGLLATVYLLSLVFSLGTHRELVQKPRGHHDGEDRGEAPPRLAWAVARLAVATVAIAALAEIAVGSVEPAAHAIGMSKVFVGVIILAVIGSAAEQSSAVFAAARRRMDLSLGIALGSSVQIALLVAPVLVFVSYLVAPRPLDLVFTRGETVALVVSATLAAHTTGHGQSTWFTGVLLLALYGILAVGFFHVSS